MSRVDESAGGREAGESPSRRARRLLAPGSGRLLRRQRNKRMLTIIASLTVIYVAIGLGLYAFQRDLIYQPQGALRDLGVEGPPLSALITSETDDGLTLEHFLLPSGDPAAPVVVVFHGNAGNAAHRWPKYSALLAEGLGLALAEYRGYGGNPGTPSEAGLIEDGRSLLQALIEEHRISPQRMILYGESLGAGVAIALAERFPVRGLVLESAFTSLVEVAQKAYPIYPADWMVKDRFANEERLSAVEAPLLVIHAAEDEIVPVAHARRLSAAAGERGETVIVEGAGHNDLHAFGIMRRVGAFSESLLPPG